MKIRFAFPLNIENSFFLNVIFYDVIRASLSVAKVVDCVTKFSGLLGSIDSELRQLGILLQQALVEFDWSNAALFQALCDVIKNKYTKK